MHEPPTPPPPPGEGETDPVTRIAAALAGPGWCLAEAFLSPAETGALAAECRALREEGGFRHARIGVGASLRLRPEIRGDRVRWIDPAAPAPALRPYLERIERLRLALNETLWLGLFEFEGFFAVYPPGGFYARHLDNFEGARHRLVTCVLYLNGDWAPGDGGELRLYTDGEDPARRVDIEPRGGTLAAFLSERFPHEVLPARRDRLSLTGWLRLRE
ncbi:MAG: 2OG-Fe(II) oxygenase [Gammaproteobacteria bacterium]|nr:2OG-Fe(II) oxygenase [Gammaproteobacteria bacterium]